MIRIVKAYNFCIFVPLIKPKVVNMKASLKKMLMSLFFVGAAFTASAQSTPHSFGIHFARPRITGISNSGITGVTRFPGSYGVESAARSDGRSGINMTAFIWARWLIWASDLRERMCRLPLA